VSDWMMMRRNWAVLWLFVSLWIGACNGFGPSTSEDEDLGSNTNWLLRCDTDAECGGELSCICGACSRYCSGPEDCESGSTCPIGRGAFQLACPQQVLEGVESSCRAGCDADEDCGVAGLCVDAVCVETTAEPCVGASELVWDSEPGTLQARVGSLFGSGFYLPGQSQLLPVDEVYQPAELAVRVLDEGGQPLVGCEVVFATEESSGYAFAASPSSDADGKVSFLWTAGSAAEQTMEAHVLTDEGKWLSVSAQGEARAHDEAPMSSDPDPLLGTRFTALGLSFPTGTATESVRVRFLPHTFPPSAIYSVFTTSGFELWLINGSTETAEVGTLSDVERLGFFRVQGSNTLAGSVLFSAEPGTCMPSGMDMVCNEPAAWSLGEETTWRIDARPVAPGEIVSDYEYGSPPACAGEVGCTDFSIYLLRAGDDPELRAIMRSPIVDDMSVRSAFLDADFGDESAFASSCLLTEQSSYFVAHEVLSAGEWTPSVDGELGASPFGFRGEVCANYAAYPRDGGYFLSAGGPSPVSTPHLPESSLSLD